jgi:hypothetical protein
VLGFTFLVSLLLLLLQGAYKLDAAAALAGIGLSRILNAPWRPASAAEPKLQVSLPKFKISQDMLPVGKVSEAALFRTVLICQVAAPQSP